MVWGEGQGWLFHLGFLKDSYTGVGRTKFLEAALMAANYKGNLKQLGALDGIAEFSGRMQFAQLRTITTELATLCPSACGGAIQAAVLERIDEGCS